MNTKQKIRLGVSVGILIGIGVLQYQLSKSKKSKNENVQNKKPLKAPKLQIEIAQKEENNKALVETLKNEIEGPNKKRTSLTVISKDKVTVFPLKLGSLGNEVKQLQAYLLKQYGWEKVTMGTFDKVTQNRVLKYLKVSEVSRTLYEKLIPNPIKLQ